MEIPETLKIMRAWLTECIRRPATYAWPRRFISTHRSSSANQAEPFRVFMQIGGERKKPDGERRPTRGRVRKMRRFAKNHAEEMTSIESAKAHNRAVGSILARLVSWEKLGATRPYACPKGPREHRKSHGFRRHHSHRDAGPGAQQDALHPDHAWGSSSESARSSRWSAWDKGAQEQAQQQSAGMGSNMLFVQLGLRSTTVVCEWVGVPPRPLIYEDMEAILRECPIGKSCGSGQLGYPPR